MNHQLDADSHSLHILCETIYDLSKSPTEKDAKVKTVLEIKAMYGNN